MCKFILNRIAEKLSSTVKLLCDAMVADNSLRKPPFGDLTPMVILAADPSASIPPHPAPGWGHSRGVLAR
jgi:hypothetical protein